MTKYTCLRCKKEVEDDEEHELDVKYIRNCGYCCDCFDDDFINNPLIFHPKPQTKGEEDV